MTYNVTDLMNTTNWADYVVILDRESGYILGITLLVVSLIIWTLIFYREGIVIGLIAAGFVTTILAIIMFGIGMLAPHYIIIPLLVMSGAFIAKKLGGD